MSSIADLEEKLFKISDKGLDKIFSLEEAVKRYIRPGSVLHFSVSTSYSFAVVYEIVRQYMDVTDRKFDVIVAGSSMNVGILVAANLVRKIITSYAGDIYPRPSPSPLIQRALMKGEIEIENLSLLTYVQRLLAGALNVEFIPTNSFRNSSLADENERRGIYKVIEDPFGSGKRIGLIKALKPDVTIVHGWAADPQGNTIIVPPLGEDRFGIFSAKYVVVTVEKIVDTSYIRKHSKFVRVPNSFVDAVVKVPFGGHPSCVRGINPHEGYAEDIDFILEYRKASKRDDTMQKWIKDWILDVKNHEGYLRKLGSKRLLKLCAKNSPGAWKTELLNKLSTINGSYPYSPVEIMTVVAARILADKVKKKKYETLLAGHGASNLAAWLAYKKLEGENISVNLLAEVGYYGYDPRPGNPFIFNWQNIPACKSIVTIFEALGMVLPNSKSIASLAAGQIDRFGNINSTKVAGIFLVGSGGANDVGTLVDEIVVTVPHSKIRLVEKVDYITTVGERVSTIVTTLGVLEKIDEEFVLTRVMPMKDETLEEKIKKIRMNTGWNLKVAEDVVEEKPPSEKELLIIRAYDPDRFYLKSS